MGFRLIKDGHYSLFHFHIQAVELYGIMVSVIIRLCRNEETIELRRQAPTLDFLHQINGLGDI